MTKRMPIARSQLLTRGPFIFGKKAQSSEQGNLEESEVILSRRVREQLNRLVSAFEEKTGSDVADEFVIKADRTSRIYLKAGTRAIELGKKSQARRIAEETLASFSQTTLQPLTQNQTVALSIDASGIALIRH